MRAAEFDSANEVWVQRTPQKEWYTIQDVCTILDVGGPSVYGAIKRGTLRGFRVNGVAHVKHVDLINYISRRQGEAEYDASGFVIEEIVPDKGKGGLEDDMDLDEVDEETELDFLDA